LRPVRVAETVKTMRAARTGPPLVLVVDDEADTRALYASCLEAKGYRVTAAADGEAALARVSDEPPDVILMDVAMPVMDGIAATRTLKSSAATAHIPVIVVTAQDTQAVLAELHTIGADAVVRKPCAPRELLALVERVIS
jgi:CheY-like chemotaxis protein